MYLLCANVVFFYIYISMLFCLNISKVFFSPLLQHVAADAALLHLTLILM